MTPASSGQLRRARTGQDRKSDRWTSLPPPPERGWAQDVDRHVGARLRELRVAAGLSQQGPQSVGVDIAKDTFDVYLHPAGRIGRFANDARGRSALIAWREGFAIARIAFEPTGAYHHALERRLAAAGLPLVKVNPRRARRFAEAIGRMPRPPRSTPPC